MVWLNKVCMSGYSKKKERENEDPQQILLDNRYLIFLCTEIFVKLCLSIVYIIGT